MATMGLKGIFAKRIFKGYPAKSHWYGEGKMILSENTIPGEGPYRITYFLKDNKISEE